MKRRKTLQNPKSGRAGFTLAEMLVVIGLMTFIIATITAIFNSSVDTSERLNSNTNLFKEMRRVLDIISEDFANIDPLDGYQNFILDNGFHDPKSGDITYDSAMEGGSEDLNIIRAADKVIFRTSTLVGDSFQHVEIKYYLESIKDRKGRPLTTIRTKQPIFRLIRERTAQNMEAEEIIYDQPPKDSRGRELPIKLPMLDFVISFNIEYLTNQGIFTQLSPSPCPSNDPLGDGLGDNDSYETPVLIEAIRISFIVADSLKENEVETFERVINLPFE